MTRAEFVKLHDGWNPIIKVTKLHHPDMQGQGYPKEPTTVGLFESQEAAEEAIKGELASWHGTWDNYNPHIAKKEPDFTMEPVLFDDEK